MDNDQITALAREYAEWVTDVPKAKELPNCLLNEANKLIADDAERMLQWLSDRFYLVEKSKVKEEYKSAKHDSKMAHRERLYTMFTVASAREALLESLFPEIAKEVET